MDVSETIARLLREGFAVVALAALAAGCAAPGTAKIRAGGYRVRIEGAPDSGLARDLLAMSDVAQNPPETPPDTGRLAVLAERDLPAMQRVLDANGFFGAHMGVEVRARPRRGPVATFRVEPGEAYRIDRIVPDVGSSSPGLVEGAAASPVALVRAARRLQETWHERGHPHARVEIDYLEIDHASRTADVHLAVSPGPVAVFGPVRFEGRRRLRQGWLRDAVPWTEGEDWKGSLLDQYRAELLASGLFSSVSLLYPETNEPGGSLPVTVSLRERPARTVSAAVGYRTDEGFGGMLAWTHRNLTGGAERLDIRGEWAEKVQAASMDFRRPRFLRRDQALRLEARVSAEQSDAFDVDSVGGAAILEREMGAFLHAEAGVAARDARIEQADRQDRFTLLYLPSALAWDGRDSPHDPSRGGRLLARFTPFHDVGSDGVWFLKNELEVTRYARLTDRPDLRVALRAGLGSIAGSGPLRIPADERFYAGGGGSVRGYAYQSLAPRSEDGLRGGRSLVETSVEIRWRTTEHLGFVAFVDGGSVMRSPWPDASERMRWGAGAGVRYHTAVGPVRLDVGIPLNRRPGIDDAWQMYISIGQAF